MLLLSFSLPLQLASPRFLAYVLSLPLTYRFLTPILSQLPFPSLHLFVSRPLSIYFVSTYLHRPFFSAPACSILLSLSLSLPNSPVLFRSWSIFRSVTALPALLLSRRQFRFLSLFSDIATALPHFADFVDFATSPVRLLRSCPSLSLSLSLLSHTLH